MGGFFLLFLCVCARLVDVQIVRQKELTAHGVKQWTRSGVVAARRGDIVDTNGRLLAQSVTSFILTARPRDVKDAGALAKVLARELGLDEETILKKLSGSKAASVTLARQLSREDADRLRAIRQNGNSPDAEALIGITFYEDASRWYPMGTLLAQTLGLCNVDGEGQSGLELQYNDVLAGKPGKMITGVDARARTLPDGVTLYVPAEQGNTLRLTIDRDVQAAVERAVRECAQVNDAVSVQAIAMDVNTGALLAIASALVFSFYSVVGKKRTPRFGGIAVTCFSFLFGSVELLAVLLLGRTAAVGGLFASLGLDIFVNVPLFSGIPLSALPALAYICAVNSAAGYVCHMMALEKTSAQEASLIFFLKPMIAPLFAFLFLREEITANMLLGIVCFLVGSGIAILPGLIAQKKQRA